MAKYKMPWTRYFESRPPYSAKSNKWRIFRKYQENYRVTNKKCNRLWERPQKPKWHRKWLKCCVCVRTFLIVYSVASLTKVDCPFSTSSKRTVEGQVQIVPPAVGGRKKGLQDIKVMHLLGVAAIQAWLLSERTALPRAKLIAYIGFSSIDEINFVVCETCLSGGISATPSHHLSNQAFQQSQQFVKSPPSLVSSQPLILYSI